jgi:hypothetical protein
MVSHVPKIKARHPQDVALFFSACAPELTQSRMAGLDVDDSH